MNQPSSRQQPNVQPALPYAEAGTQRAAGPSQFATPGGGQGIPSLEIQSNTHGERPTYDLTKPVINIGRDPSNEIVIDAPVVSGLHAQIVREGNQLILVHPHPLRSQTTNGLLYQGRHILGNEPFRKPLVRGDIFRIGNEHGTLVTLTYNDGSGARQEIVPEIRPIPSGAPVTTIASQPRHPQAQPNNHQQGRVHHRQKFRRPTSKEVKVALIGTVGTILVAIITYILGPTIVNGSSIKQIPRLHSSYTGSYSVTRQNWSAATSGPLMFSSIAEDDQGQVQSDMVLGSAKYSCQGSVNTSRNLVLSCTKVGEANLQVVVNGHASQDEGQLSGTWSASDPTRSSLYADATWSAQG